MPYYTKTSEQKKDLCSTMKTRKLFTIFLLVSIGHLVTGQLLLDPLFATGYFIDYFTRIVNENRQSPLSHYTVHGAANATYNIVWKPFYNALNRPWSQLFTLPKETHMNTIQLIENQGFKSEEHEVITTDGYKLVLHRVISTKDGKDSRKGTPILLANPMLCCTSRAWVMNYRNQSFGFILADAGYDVWLSNYRGGNYSRRHLKYKDNTKEFWSFSYDEMGKIDLPQMIDFIIEKTGHKKIFVGGAGLGFTPIVMMLADLPKYNDKMHGVISMSGVDSVFDTKLRLILKGTFRIFNQVIKFLDINDNWGLAYNIRPKFPYWPLLVNIFAPALMHIILPINTEGLMPPPSTYDMTRLPIVFGTFPVAFNWQMVNQVFQIFEAAKLVHYDWGNMEENMKRHGTSTAEPYDLKKISAHILIIYTPKDHILGKDTALQQQKRFPKTTLYQVPEIAWQHWCYMICNDGKPVFDRAIEFMREQEKLTKLV